MKWEFSISSGSSCLPPVGRVAEAKPLSPPPKPLYVCYKVGEGFDSTSSDNCLGKKNCGLF